MNAKSLASTPSASTSAKFCSTSRITPSRSPPRSASTCRKFRRRRTNNATRRETICSQQSRTVPQGGPYETARHRRYCAHPSGHRGLRVPGIFIYNAEGRRRHRTHPCDERHYAQCPDFAHSERLGSGGWGCVLGGRVEIVVGLAPPAIRELCTAPGETNLLAVQ